MTTHREPSLDALKRYANRLGVSEIYTKQDPRSGLNAIIAIHNTDTGPAIGGTRFQPYPCYPFALQDAIKLSRMMALKSAIIDLPHGGAKAVITAPNDPSYDREALFETFGCFVDELNGRYIASLDAGTTQHDMDSVAEKTNHVIGTSEHPAHIINPSIFTAQGIYLGIETAVEFYLSTTSLDGLVVVIQGAGHVASHLIKSLVAAGAIVHTCDIDQIALDTVRDMPNVTIHDPNTIYDIPCDIFSPCALGGTITTETIDRLNTKIIAGAANNQLAHKRVAGSLQKKDIAYIPDFVINAGGLISASAFHHGIAHDNIANKLSVIPERLEEILLQAKSNNRTTNDIAFEMAFKRMQANHDNAEQTSI